MTIIEYQIGVINSSCMSSISQPFLATELAWPPWLPTWGSRPETRSIFIQLNLTILYWSTSIVFLFNLLYRKIDSANLITSDELKVPWFLKCNPDRFPYWHNRCYHNSWKWWYDEKDDEQKETDWNLRKVWSEKQGVMERSTKV